MENAINIDVLKGQARNEGTALGGLKANSFANVKMFVCVQHMNAPYLELVSPHKVVRVFELVILVILIPGNQLQRT